MGTTATDAYQEYNSAVGGVSGGQDGLMYDEDEGNYNEGGEQQPNLMRYGSDPELREAPVRNQKIGWFNMIPNGFILIPDSPAISWSGETVGEASLSNGTELEGGSEATIAQ